MKEIEKLKKTDEVSCGNISASTMGYAKQKRIPFILIYASLSGPRCFFYVDLQTRLEDVKEKIWNSGKKKVTVRIPFSNRVETDLTGFFELINSYY